MSTSSERKFEQRLPTFEPLADTLERVADNIGQRNGKPELTTGLRVLDEGIFGLHRTQLTVVAARPGIGKTSLVCQVALNLVRQNIKVAFLSLEMTKESILERMFCIENNINGFDLIMGKFGEREQNLFSKFSSEIAGTPLRIIDDYCHTENELYTLIEHLQFRPDVIILDHLQHIQSIGKRSQWETLTEYLRYLKEISMKHKIAIVCLSQINREGDEAPSMTNLKGTGGIEEMADHVLLMHDLKGELTENGNNFKIRIAKNRFGPVRTFDLWFAKECSKFIEQSPFARNNIKEREIVK